MTPEAQSYLHKAREDLDDARKIMAINLAKVAARSAYYAAFHAAEALIVERTGKIAKTHSGVRAALARLLTEAPSDQRSLLTFLARAYQFKEIGDYGVGHTAVITDEEARSVIEGAEQFLAAISGWLSVV